MQKKMFKKYVNDFLETNNIDMISSFKENNANVRSFRKGNIQSYIVKNPQYLDKD